MAGGRSFAFLLYPPPSGGTDNYLTNHAAAEKVVEALSRMGVRTFLLIAASMQHCRTIGTAIESAGLEFYTDERWPWSSALDAAGHFRTQHYLQNRVVAELEPLKEEFPSTFTGFHFRDEPGLTDLDALGAQTDCLRSRPLLAGMPVFLNLFPIHVNYAGMSGLAQELARARPPSDYGVNCETGHVDVRSAQLMAKSYGVYVRTAMEKVRPDYLAFDLYPFDGALATCAPARELTVSENLSNIAHAARMADATPVAYLQNFQTNGGFRANFHHLRWFASWAFAFGVHDFANFLSHSNADAPSATGLLDTTNRETYLGVDQRSVFGFVRHLQQELDGARYLGFVARFLGVSSGEVVATFDSDQAIVGEYHQPSSAAHLLFVARRGIEPAAEVTIGFAQNQRVEELDVATGAWAPVADSAETLHVSLDSYPGTLYRLRSP